MRLGQRLLWVELAVVVLGLGLLASRLDAGHDKVAYLSVVAGLVVALAAVARPTVSAEARGVVVVGVLLGATAIGCLRFGITAGSSLALAAAAVLASLLLGRRAAVVTVGLGVAIIVTVGVLISGGHIAAPVAANFDPRRAGVWIRAGAFTLLFVTIITTAVSWTIEQIEAAVARADAEIERRRDAEAKALAGQQAELLSRLAAGFAHDLNNHLTVISMWSNLLERNAADAHEAQGEIQTSIQQATSLTRQMLVLGRRDVRNLRPLSMAAVLEAHATTLRRMLPADIRVELRPAEGAGWCRADEAQLHQLLLNLALNARDAMPDGGLLTLSAGDRMVDGKPFAFVEIADDGIGMSEDVRCHACEPFFTTKPPGKGTGLGLATARAIAEQGGGALELESAPGRGTRVTLRLPAGEPATAAPVVTPAARTPMRGRVLLVEDAAPLLAAARRTLVEAGCEVVVASDGDEALARLGEGTFDLLCTDAVMPGRPGREVIAAFEQSNPGAPVLLCSGYVAEELVRRGLEEQRYRFLAKPYTPAQLLTAVEELLAPRVRRARLALA